MIEPHLSVDEVVECYAPIVRRQLKQLQIHKEYDDYYQIGLIALWEAYKRFDPAKGNFPTFAIHTVRGRLLTELSKEKTYAAKHHVTDEGFHYNVDERNTSMLEVEIIDCYIETLSERQQTWVKETILEGKTTSEIAKDYNVSVYTVRSWKKAAIKKLKLELA
ncbi:MAG: sigma-70 family RNA polymerase sigma factor [Bacillaceae bacterium]|nr:sigma-70 family RNA polymerase sigma factor [Bacillaceae bacterium]